MSKFVAKELSVVDKIRHWFGGKSIIVFTMGKVGTLSLCNSFEYIGYKTVHPHSLRWTKPGVHFLFVPLTPTKKIKYLWLTMLKRIKVKLWLLVSRKPIKIITGVRDPFARGVSSFFQQSEYLKYNPSENNISNNLEIFHKFIDYYAPLKWFDLEVKTIFGIDVYNYPFDKVKGYSVIQNKYVSLFVYRVDMLNGLEDEIAQFINDESFQLRNINTASEKDYHAKYEEFKKNARFPKAVLDEYRGSKFMSHFFSQHEIDAICRKWER